MKAAVLALLLVAPVIEAPSAAVDPAYRVLADWPSLPAGVSSGDGSGIAVNGRGEVLALHRGNRPWASAELATDPITVPVLMVLDARTGRLLRAWGAGLFAMPHGISVDAEDNFWITDVALHQVFKFSREGKLLLTLGERGVPGDDSRHFNRPTDVVVMTDGSFYVADGYRNSRIVKFAADGSFAFQWGVAGTGPGQFDVPHSLALGRDGRLYVCDRDNARVQVFDRNGRYLTRFALPGLGRPFAIVTLGPDRFAVAGNDRTPDSGDTAGVEIIDSRGRVSASFGRFGTGRGEFKGAHDIAAGGDGTLYVADVKGPHFQKFAAAGD